MMKRARSILQTEKAWNQRCFGQEITVAVLDTGAYPHPDYKSRVVYFKDFIHGRIEMYDDYGHGTHVTGILGGDGSLNPDCTGIAPKIRIVSLKVLDRNGNGRREDVVQGICWVIDHRKQYGIRIMNISVGTVKEGDRKDEILVKMAEEAWNEGIVVVAAAGNMGPRPYTITAPGISPSIITVGSSDEMETSNSGRGPTRDCVCKPDIVAPGAGIFSCSSRYRKKDGYYCRKSGTSMATPMVSGAAALLLCREPWITNVEVKMRLWESAVDLGMEQNRQGWGLLNIPSFLHLR